MERFFAFVFACLMLLLPRPSFSQQSDVTNEKNIEQRVLKLNDELIKAEIAMDQATMDRLYTADYTHTHGAGEIESRAGYMNDFKTGVRRYEAYDLSDENIRLYGTTALITGRADVKAIRNGIAARNQNIFLAVWVLQQGNWKNAAWVTTRIDGNQPPAGPRQ